MTGSPFPVTQFGGLRLDLEADEVPATQAIDLLNVVPERGAVRVRDGSAKFNATAGANNFLAVNVWQKPSTTSQVIAVDDAANLRSYGSNGVLIASVAATTSHGFSVAAIGTGAAGPYLYIGGNDSSAIRRWDGAAFSAPAGMPNGRYLALQPSDNRLVAAHTATTERSRVKFSDAGAPETWGANNYVDLHPNDGEEITGMVAWRDQLFVFKQTKFFNFYGNGTDADGEPIFNYRTFGGGVGAIASAATSSVVAAPTGVYFLGTGGIYRTTGGEAVKVSGALEPIFTAHGNPWFASGRVVNLTTFGRSFADSYRVIFPLQLVTPVTGAGGTFFNFVYYPAEDQWAVQQQPNLLAPQPLLISGSTRPSMVVASELRIYVEDREATTDDGTAIASRWRSGFYTAGNTPDQEVKIRETILDGIGTPSASVSRDFGAVPTTGGGAKTAVTLGTSPAIAQGRHRVAQRGRRFSTQIEATSGAWRVESLVHHVTGVRDPGLKTT